VNCMPSVEPTAERCAPPAKLQAPEMPGERVRERRAAVVYLRAAAGADTASVRNALRRRAAELILPRTARRRPAVA